MQQFMWHSAINSLALAAVAVMNGPQTAGTLFATAFLQVLVALICWVAVKEARNDR